MNHSIIYGENKTWKVAKYSRLNIKIEINTCGTEFELVLNVMNKDAIVNFATAIITFAISQYLVILIERKKRKWENGR